MIFSLDVRRAGKGDCLLIHFGTSDAPGLILVDGGPSGIYSKHLKPRLRDIRAQRRGLPTNAPLDVDLMMVSHIDDDHVAGILDLTKGEVEAVDAQRPRQLNVLDFWHNSFDDVLGNLPPELTEAMKSTFGAAAASGAPLSDEALARVEERSTVEPEVTRSSLALLASAKQGYQLRHDADRLGYPLNSPFGGALVMSDDAAVTCPLSDELTLDVIAPAREELLELQKEHDRWIKELAEQGKSPDDVLAAYADTSPTNLASIVALVRCGEKSILLTGDARGDHIIAALERTGMVAKGGVLEVDVLKVPHHGSARNLETDFFERIVARHYVYSGDGEHGNPERKALEMLLDARGSASFDLHFTYPLEEIDGEREKDWEKERTKELKKRESNPSRTVRPEWNSTEHGLVELFEQRPLGAGQAMHVVDAGAPHVIDLLDSLGY